MRAIIRFLARMFTVRGMAVAAAVVYVMQPAAAAAQNTQLNVCGQAGNACSNFVTKYINPFILLFTALVAVAAVISYIVAAIQYSAAGDDTGAVNKAKNRIFQTTIGLIGYIFLFAFLNFIIPGGLF